MTGSASGRLFMHYMPRDLVMATFNEQRAEGYPGRFTGELPDVRTIADELEKVGLLGYAATESYPQPGVSAICAPLFDAGGQMTMALTVIGTDTALDVRPDSDDVRGTLDLSRRISAKLGYSEETAKHGPGLVRPYVESGVG
jgi:DNA-binding IclR family transcriptional regulator